MRLRDIEIYIVCESSRPLREYGVEQVEDNVMTAFVPSEAGKAFKVVSKNFSSTTSMTGRLLLDGCRVRSFCTQPKTTNVIDMAYISQNVQRPFLFTERNTLDDQGGEPIASANLEHLGTIQVDLHRCLLDKLVPWEPHVVKKLETKQIDGTSLELVRTHRVSLGEKRVVSHGRVKSTEVKLLDPKNKPYARFIFKCRPAEILQAEGIIPSVMLSLSLGGIRGLKTDDIDETSASLEELRSPSSTNDGSLKPSRSVMPKSKKTTRNSSRDTKGEASLQSLAYPQTIKPNARPSLSRRATLENSARPRVEVNFPGARGRSLDSSHLCGTLCPLTCSTYPLLT